MQDRPHRGRRGGPALLLALGPMVFATPAAAAVAGAHTPVPAASTDLVSQQPQVRSGPGGTLTIRVGQPGADSAAALDPSGQTTTPATSSGSSQPSAGSTASSAADTTGPWLT